MMSLWLKKVFITSFAWHRRCKKSIKSRSNGIKTDCGIFSSCKSSQNNQPFSVKIVKKAEKLTKSQILNYS